MIHCFVKEGVVSKVVIPVKTGIQINIIKHDFWIPAGVYPVPDTGRE